MLPLHGPSAELTWRTTEECARRLSVILRIASSRDGNPSFVRLQAEEHTDEMERALDFIESIRSMLISN
jgi:hypothetical protein